MEEWFQSLWDTINGWITGAISGLWTTVSSAFDTVKTWITDGLSAAWTSISAAFDTVKTWITDGLSVVWSDISAAFSSIQAQVRGAMTFLTDSVSTFFSDLWGKVQSAANSIVNSISTFFSDLWAKISTGLADAAKSLVDGLSAAVGTIAGYVQDALKGVAEAVGGALRGALEWLWSGLSFIAGKIMDAIGTVRAAVEPAFTTIMSGVTGTVTEAFKPSTLPDEVKKASDELAKNLQDTMQRLMPKGAHSLPPFESVQQSALLTTAVFTGASILGNVAGIAIDLVHPIKPIGVQVAIASIIRSVSENVVTAPIIQIPLEAGVYRPLRYYYNKMNPYAIPGAGDMINMVVREAIPVDVFKLNMLYQGFDEYWTTAYWEAHWVLPGFGDLRAAWWRGVIGDDQFNAYIVLHDYKPEPRKEGWVSDQDMIAALSYELPGRIDARWMFEQGVIDTDTHLQLTRARGMHPDWAEKVVEAEERAAIRAEVEASIRENAAIYAAGRWTEAEFRDMVAALDLGPKLTEFWVARANAMRARKLWLDRLDSLDYAYRYDIMTQDAYIGELEALEVTSDVVAMKVVNQDMRKKGSA